MGPTVAAILHEMGVIIPNRFHGKPNFYALVI